MKMKKEIKYTDAPPEVDVALKAAIESGERIHDLIPSPEQLVKKVEKQKVTIVLKKNTVDFFKQVANENGVKYQTMINSLLDSYVENHSKV
ncbi:MAG: BrnA antitoxin family protein [Coriobacteriia bacterium]|nr:BrnA antitoxin family protein [Coriobacteriia bacterium]